MKEDLRKISVCNPKVSVIIPTYNGGKYIGESIESVLNQTYKDFEIIIVDDGSSDDLNVNLRPYSRKIKYLYTRNQGPAAARNLGIKLGKGKYIALLDHDDIWAPDNLEEKVRILDENPHCSMVYSYSTLIDSAGNVIENEPPAQFPSGRVFREFLEKNRVTSFSATLIRKEIFQKVGYLDENKRVTTCDDYDMWLRIANVSYILFCPGQQVSYRIHRDNLVRNYDQNLSAHLFVYWKAIKKLESTKSIPFINLIGIIVRHLYNIYFVFAYKYYYDASNYRKARSLLFKSILLKPLIAKNWIYLIICLMPSKIIKVARMMKKKMKHSRYLEITR